MTYIFSRVNGLIELVSEKSQRVLLVIFVIFVVHVSTHYNIFVLALAALINQRLQPVIPKL